MREVSVGTVVDSDVVSSVESEVVLSSQEASAPTVEESIIADKKRARSFLFLLFLKFSAM